MSQRHALSLCTIPLITLSLLTGCDSGSPPAPTETKATTAAPAAPAPKFAAVDGARLVAAASEPGQWLTHGGSYSEQRFSQLDRVNTSNISQLGLAWFADFDTNRGQESTPLMIDGTVYVTSAWSKVFAYDAKTGASRWTFDPKVPGEHGSKGCCDVVNRGVAAWNGKVYVGTYDGRLIAIDAATGKEVWSVVTVDQSKYYSITGAPRAVKGRILIGNAGAEYETRGYVSAYDAETGALAWRFYTVPGNPADGFENEAMAAAAKTWTGEWWKLGGGGSTWDAITYDPVTDLVFVGVGNGSPWNSAMRSPANGDNLYTDSIIALKPDTGELVWHYQEVPSDEWDFDATQQIIVADLQMEGAVRHVLMQAAKSGFIYVIDSTTGKLISANNFVPVNWTTGYDLATGRPNLNEAIRYSKVGGPVIVQPGPQGAHNWQPVSYSPATGLAYIPAQEVSITYTNAPESAFGAFRLGVDWMSGTELYDRPGNTIPRLPMARLVAWDPIRQQEIWSRRYDGRPAGVLTTAGGLLFQGDGNTQELVAYRADTGERLWAAPTRTGVAAGPISYAIEGEQFIAQVVGGGQRGGYYAPTHARLLVFKLGGAAELPPAAPYTAPELNPPPATATPEVITAGAAVYNSACSMCHGANATNRGMFPDLRYSAMLHSAEAFNAVVLQGALRERGMVAYSEMLSEADSAAVQAYLIQQAHAARNAPPGP